MIAPGVDAHAHALLADELERRSGAFGLLPVSSRANVQAAAERTVSALADAIVAYAACEPALAAALRSIYGPTDGAEGAAVAAPWD